MGRLRDWARSLKSDVAVLAAALRDPRTPWHAKALAWCVVAYALSPIDLIPDFIPVLGHLDDLVLVPLGVWLVMRLIPADVLAECRMRQTDVRGAPDRSAWGCAPVVIGLWLAGLGAALGVVYGWLAR